MCAGECVSLLLSLPSEAKKGKKATPISDDAYGHRGRPRPPFVLVVRRMSVRNSGTMYSDRPHQIGTPLERIEKK